MNEYTNMIEIKEVTKSFREVRALDRISMQMEKGKIYGLVGRNGSGKTVLLKCICGFMQPDTGEIRVRGQVHRNSYPEKIGIILEEPGFIDSASGQKNLEILSAMGVGLTKEQIREVLVTVGLDPDSKKKVKHYSLGMRHRLGIAQAIMEKPDILLLDEPMNGLDIEGVTEMRRLFLKLKEEGTTIVLASHYREDIEALCDETWTLDRGTIIQHETA